MVTLTPRTFTLDLTPGVPVTELLQSGVFIIGEATVDVATVPGTLSRTVTANGVSGTIAQPVRRFHLADHGSSETRARHDHPPA